MPAVAFEIKNRVHHVFEDARTGDGAVFGHVTDEESRQAGFFCQNDDRSRTLPHLRNASGSGRQRRSENRLDRIDNQDGGLGSLHLIEDTLEGRFAQDKQIRCGDVQPLGAHLDLSLRFLAGYVEARQPLLADGCEGLQEKRGLADARVAAD